MSTVIFTLFFDSLEFYLIDSTNFLNINSLWKIDIQWNSRNIILVKYATLNCDECPQDQATASSSVYCHISFSPYNKKFVFVKSTSKQKIPKKEMGCLRQNQAC